MKKSDRILDEALRLHRLGFAIHWLHVKSKRPVESGWTTGPRKKWEYLEKTYRKGLNVGVRLGTPSKLETGYLCVVDVDVKSKAAHHKAEALNAAENLVGGQIMLPMVISGRGNGSRHYYCVTKKPFKTFNPAESREQVKVPMPSKSPSKRELTELSASEIKAGIRIANAWEISLYSDGRQVVLPPSIHPDSGEEYRWGRKYDEIGDLKLLSFVIPEENQNEKETNVPRGTPRQTLDDFELSPVEISWLPISDRIRDAITKGVGVTDRSAYLMVATSALLAQGLSKNEILTVLTEPDTFLGACAYDHAKTTSRKRAADWLWNYTVRGVMEERSAKAAFAREAIIDEVELDEEATEKQAAQIKGERNWKQDLSKTDKGGIKHTIENVVRILENEVSPQIFRRDVFAYRDTYGADTPWGGKKDRTLDNDDAALIRLWCGRAHGLEPSKDLIYDAITNIAVTNSYDPVLDFLKDLPAWDGEARLDSWLMDHFEAKGQAAYVGQVFRKWMVALVMRAYEPGAKFDWMPIFEGMQGVGKSSFGKILVGEKFFLDKLPNLEDKDAALALQGIWLVEMGELATLRRNEIDVIKGYLTRQIDKVRPPFGRLTVELPRRCVFFGSTNRETYLRDESGNRRFKPVQVGNLNFRQLEEDREQLFAEAKHLYETFQETGETLEMTGVAKEFEAKIQKEKMVADDSHLMMELIKDFKEKVTKSGEELEFDFSRFSLQDLWSGNRGTGPLHKMRFDQKNMQLAGKALVEMGGEKRKIKGRIFWKLSKNEENGV